MIAYKFEESVIVEDGVMGEGGCETAVTGDAMME